MRHAVQLVLKPNSPCCLSVQRQTCLLGLLPTCQLLLFLSRLQAPESCCPTDCSTQILLHPLADACKPQTDTPMYTHSLAAHARYIHHSTDVTFSAAVVQHMHKHIVLPSKSSHSSRHSHSFCALTGMPWAMAYGHSSRLPP